MRFFNYEHFNDLNFLLELKRGQGVRIGVALPVCNEEKTIGRTIEIIQSCGALVDETIALDSGSHDESSDICKRYGIPMIDDSETAQKFGIPLSRGKGWNLWSSLYHLDTDIILWIDSDIQNIDSRFITGLVGPLLVNKELQFIKGCYNRPKGDARVTELMARPLISLFFPELKDFIQPLSGEYGGRRATLERMEFYSGYSVEMALLIQTIKMLSADEIAQVYLGERIHKLQDVPALGKMSASILKTVLRMASEHDRIHILSSIDEPLYQYVMDGTSSFKSIDIHITDVCLPPMITINSYLEKIAQSDSIAV